MPDPSPLGRFVPEHLVMWDDVSVAPWRAVDGTLCFVDISGFTNLSERLATRGRVGAEELTEVLSRVFGEMLDIAAVRGGALLKFGGDALLTLFQGPDHPVQAASAAVEMRAALRQAASIPTSVGRVPLRMSVGLHTGEVLLFRARGTHDELIVAGPGASMVTHMEGTAEAGEIVISAATRDRIPDGAASDPKGDGFLLRWRSPRCEVCGIIPFAPPDPEVVRRSVPTALRRHLEAVEPEPEHRLATVGFVKFKGIDALVGELGPAGVSEAFDHLIASVTEIVDSEDVTFLATDVDEDAGKIILVAGVPVTQVDEEGRMLRVARRVADLETPFGLEVGVNRGHVFSGAVGSRHRAAYTIMGDTVNLAARMMAAAPIGSIYAAPTVVDRSTTLYRTERVEPFRVKGKSNLVQAFAVCEEIGTRTEREASRVPFVAREAELAAVRDALAATVDGTGGVVTVRGPTGIGKSRLVDEGIEGYPGRIIEVRAEPYGAANPYRPFRDPVRTLLGVERGTNEEMAASMAAALAERAPGLVPVAPLIGDVTHIEMPPTTATRSIEPRFRQERAIAAIVDLFDAVLDGPVAFIAEDMHWADGATEALLDRLATATADRPWALIQTGRESSAEGTVHLELEPLDEEETRDLVHGATEAAPLRPEVVAAVVERSGGSPLFALELVSAVRETGDISSLPTSLDGVVGSQIDSLEPLPRQVLRYLSVLGRSFRVSVARELLAALDIALDDATRSTLSGFLENDGRTRLQFRHAMVRDVAYEGLSFRRRRELHSRAGELVLAGAGADDEAVADILALHFHLGGDGPRTWRYARIAGDRNMELYANVEAATQFERAIDVGRRLDGVTLAERRALWIKLGDVRERSGEFDGSLEAYRRASRLTEDDPNAKAEVLLKRARAKERAGTYSSALAETTRARHLVEGVDDPRAKGTLAQVLSYAALIRQAQQRPREALAAAREAEAVAEAVGDKRAMARAWRAMDYAHVMLGDLDAAVNSERALEVYREIGDLDEEAGVSTNLGAFAFWRGDWQKAIEYYQIGHDASIRVGNMVDAANAAANIGEVLVNQGRCEEAADPLDEAHRVFLASGFAEGVAFVDLLLGRMYGIQGDLGRSEEALRSAIDHSRELGLDASQLEASVYLADAVCRRGDPEDALAVLDEARQAAPTDYLDYYSPLFSRVRGSVLDAAGRHEDAVAALAAGISIARERGEAYELGLLVLTMDRVAPEAVEDEAVTDAKGALHTLGVQSAPGVALVG